MDIEVYYKFLKNKMEKNNFFLKFYIFPTESPTLSNIYMQDTPPIPANINILSYADDFTITSTHNGIPTATAQLQSNLNNIMNASDELLVDAGYVLR